MTRSEQKAALEAIEQTPARFVYARRKGICVAGPVHKKGGRFPWSPGATTWICFRREGDKLTAEHWTGRSGYEEFEVFPELRERVEKVIDR